MFLINFLRNFSFYNIFFTPLQMPYLFYFDRHKIKKKIISRIGDVYTDIKTISLNNYIP